jgi:hypothetical protein
MNVTRPPTEIVTVDGLTRPSAPIVIVAVEGLPPGVVGVVGLVGVVGVPPPPPPHAATATATAAAAIAPERIEVRIRKISSRG